MEEKIIIVPRARPAVDFARFVCKDGKVLRELTNFRVEELHK
jgi:hypothetical protein